MVLGRHPGAKLLFVEMSRLSETQAQMTLLYPQGQELAGSNRRRKASLSSTPSAVNCSNYYLVGNVI